MALYHIMMLILQSMFVFLIGTLIYDLWHYFLHKCLKSSNAFLLALGRLHIPHHRFFSASLKIETQWAKRNLLNHAIAEYLIQCAGILLCATFMPLLPIMIALLAQTGIFIHICYCRGVDLHHRSYSLLPSYRGGIYVSAEYHALHHVYPNRFYSSYIKLIDYLFGTGQQIAGKRIAMTGANGALGSNMKRLLEKEGAHLSTFQYGVDYTYDDYEKLKETLENTDILLLCHGSKYENAQQANCDSFVEIIELFKRVKERKLIPIEVWGVGSEIECHPCFGIKKLKVYADSKRNYAKKARLYFRDKDIQYRHIVHSAFTSRMGPGLMSARMAAFLTLFLLKRGFRYIPVSYTGFAYLNYLRFVFNR